MKWARSKQSTLHLVIVFGGSSNGLQGTNEARSGVDEMSVTHFLMMKKGEEQYIVLYKNDQRRQAIQTLGRWASFEELSLSWSDAAKLALQVRQDRGEVSW